MDGTWSYGRRDGDRPRHEDEPPRAVSRRPSGRGRVIAAALRGAVLVAAIVIAVAACGSGRSSRATTPPSSSAPASGCGPLRPRIATAAAGGRSVIEAFGHLTGRTRTEDATPYREMALTGVHTISGPKVPATTVGWLRTTPYPAPAPADAPGLWAPDGHLVAIVSPAAVANTTIGPILSIAPIVGGNVILNAASCWSDPDLPTTPFAGPLVGVPGSGAHQLAQRYGGFHAYPLTSLAALATR